MDQIDLKILAILQNDATATVADIATQIGLSPSPCWKRIRKLEANGTLLKRVALVSPAKVGLGICAYIAIRTGDLPAEAIESFTRLVATMPEVIEFSRTTGDVDYLLQAVVADIEAYDALYERLTAIVPFGNVTTHLVLRRIKSTTALPLAAGGNGRDVVVSGIHSKHQRRATARA
jgi:Lrp/AsnC family transcriptional regulator